MKKYLYELATDAKKGVLAGILKFLLFILSLIYGLVIALLIPLNCALRRLLNVKVISVGNITVGGTGKTSLVEYIARYLKDKGRKVVILTRGYKRRVSKVSMVSTVSTVSEVSGKNMGDEPYMLQTKLKDVPVIVDADRIRGVKKAIEQYSADTVILDDGFQQWKIKKDLEVVAIDAVNPFGNGFLLPRGTLREPLCSLKRADIFILTKVNLAKAVDELKAKLSRINTKAEIFESSHIPLGFYNIDKPGSLLAAESLRGKTACIFSGIGDPDSFEKLIASLGINIIRIFRFQDHHDYSAQDLDKIVKCAKEKNIDSIITTEKDAARLLSTQSLILNPNLFVLRIKIAIKEEQKLHDRLFKLFSI